MIADDLKDKTWKVYGNIFLLYPLIRVLNTPMEKKCQNFWSPKPGMQHINIFHTIQGSQI